jgi:hypothetical protein
MKEDKLLTALERVAAGHGKPHPAKTGLGLSYDQIDDLSNLIDVAIEEFREQLIVTLEDRGYYEAASVVDDADYR